MRVNRSLLGLKIERLFPIVAVGDPTPIALCSARIGQRVCVVRLRRAGNVTRCGYAAFYQEPGLADIGALVHCSRDHAMAAAFERNVELVRIGTIMEGKPCCDFRLRKKPRA
jgi:L-2-amino-thiazoline-4-carboxylic acid hydrolase